MAWGVSATGLSSATDLLERVQTRFDGSAAYVCGPTVEYAIYVDRGTSRMEARPFVKPAAERVGSDIGGHASRFLDGDVVEAGEEGVVRATALAVQEQMQRIITEKGAVDTGAMRASVTIERVS